jgi:hypothetical protein
MFDGVKIKEQKPGEYIIHLSSNPLRGQLTLESFVEFEIKGIDNLPKKHFETRKVVIEDSVIVLQKLVSQFLQFGSVQGKIILQEFEEFSLPDEYKILYSKLIKNEEELKSHIKLLYPNTLETNIYALSKRKNKIYRFFKYDPTGKALDLLVDVDYIASVKNITAGNSTILDSHFSLAGIKSVVSNNARIGTSTISKDQKPRIINNGNAELDKRDEHQHANMINKESASTSIDFYQDSTKIKQNRAISKAAILLTIIGVITIAILFSNYFLGVVGLGIFILLTYLFGSISKELFAPNSKWSFVLILIVGLISIYLLGSLSEGCNSSEPDSGWRRP